MSKNDPYGISKLKEKQEQQRINESNLDHRLSDILDVMKKMSDQLVSIEKAVSK